MTNIRNNPDRSIFPEKKAAIYWMNGQGKKRSKKRNKKRYKL